jgi:hypothetical protein
MPAHRWRGGAGRGGELARAAGTFAQELNHPLAGRVGERRQEWSQLACHLLNIYHMPKLLRQVCSLMRLIAEPQLEHFDREIE